MRGICLAGTVKLEILYYLQFLLSTDKAELYLPVVLLSPTFFTEYDFWTYGFISAGWSSERMNQ